MKTARNSVRRVPNGAVSDKPIAVRLHPEELERFKSRAAREQRSMASVLRLAALRGLDECDRTNTLLAS
ncbi:hypothetical protein SAMN05518800_3213 [Variovorax sp. YR752]|uniref:BrnA antitoxin family protein n=1 Tax=Variovorax sp. YR752 TaxID=1884383 RepID=UPI000BD93F59|nr:BrnA antitoxin family protein [Variovorax sp. YR752]SOD27649.1 hypothetical protein SAMN05518800_3213 [Variovorax sp. YR752]